MLIATAPVIFIVMKGGGTMSVLILSIVGLVASIFIACYYNGTAYVVSLVFHPIGWFTLAILTYAMYTYRKTYNI